MRIYRECREMSNFWDASGEIIGVPPEKRVTGRPLENSATLGLGCGSREMRTSWDASRENNWDASREMRSVRIEMSLEKCSALGLGCAFREMHGCWDASTEMIGVPLEKRVTGMPPQK